MTESGSFEAKASVAARRISGCTSLGTAGELTDHKRSVMVQPTVLSERLTEKLCR